MVGEQTNDYNCGVFAAMYYLEKYFGIEHIEYQAGLLGSVAGTTPENGTSHEGVYSIFGSILSAPVLTYKYNASVEDLISNLPAIVNCQSDGEGHYIVITDGDSLRLQYWDPADGKNYSIYNPEEWARKYWYSNLYGTRWFLNVSRKSKHVDEETSPSAYLSEGE